MTTIAYRSGVIAADTLACWGSNRDGYATKVAKRGPYLAGASGALDACQGFLEWFRSGCVGNPPKMPHDGDRVAFGVIVTPEDLVLTWTPHGWERTRNPVVGMGSGGEFAQGAMAAGATPEEAVRIACQFDTKSGGEITVLRAA